MPITIQAKRSVKREFEEQQRLSALANRELLLQELDGLKEQASIYFRNFEINGVRRHWLLPNEILADLHDPEKVECVIRYMAWFKAQIARVEMDVIP